VYEDGDIAFELTLVDPVAEAVRPVGSPRLLKVGPITALERLAEVDAEVVELAVRIEEALGELPLVVGLVSDRTWQVPRGFVEQLLYGPADHVVITPSEVGQRATYTAGFRPNGRSLFSDPVCRHVTGLWWLSPSTDGDPLGVQSSSNVNPS
jgi:hypothetical protein